MAGGVVPANIVGQPIMNRGPGRDPSDRTAADSRRQRIRRAVVIHVIALGAVAWLVIAGRSTLSVDELFSLAMATGHSLEHPAAIADERLGDWVEAPIAVPAVVYRRYLAHDEPPAPATRVLRAVRLSDTSPPLYYVLLHYWTRAFGTGDRALRLFSVMCAAGAFPFLMYLARRAGGPAAVVPVCVLFVVSPSAVAYASEGRMYALVWLLSSALISLTLILGRHGPPRPTLVLWVVTGAAGLLTHYFFAFIWAACVIWLAVHRARWRTTAFWAAVLATALIVAPWYVTIPETLHQWRVTAGWLDGRLGRRNTVLGPLKLTWGLLSGHGDWDRAGLLRWPLTAVLASLAVVLVRTGRRRALVGPGLLLALCVAAASLGLLLLDLALGTLTTLFPRYALAGLPPALTLVATALARIRSPWRAALLSLLTVAALAADWTIYTATSRHDQAFRDIAADLRATAPSGDVVALVHSVPSGVLGVSRYADPDVRIASWVGQLRQRRVPESIAALTSGGSVVVFIQIHAVGEPAPEEDWLRNNATVIHEGKRGVGRLVTFRPSGGVRFGQH